eukprot:1624359-Amphidinium_carterae.2
MGIMSSKVPCLLPHPHMTRDSPGRSNGPSASGPWGSWVLNQMLPRIRCPCCFLSHGSGNNWFVYQVSYEMLTVLTSGCVHPMHVPLKAWALTLQRKAWVGCLCDSPVCHPNRTQERQRHDELCNMLLVCLHFTVRSDPLKGPRALDITW